MEDIVRGALAGVAFAGFVVAVFEANQIAVQALWRLNCLAAEMAWFTVQAAEEKIRRERQQLVEDEYDSADEADDEDEN